MGETIGAQIGKLQFSKENFSGPQKISILSSEDENSINENAVIEIGGEGYSPLRISVEIKDNDRQRILTYNSPSVLPEGKSSSFRVRLNTRPAGPVTVSLLSSDCSSLTVDRASLVFTSENYSTEQTVNLSAPEDSDSASEISTVSLSMAGAENETVSVKIIDNDISSVFSMPSASVNEGMSTVIAVQLNGEPGANQTVSLSSSIPGVTVSPANLNFTSADWSVPQSVTLTGLQDANAENETGTLTAAGTGLTSASIPLTSLDDEVQSVIFSGPAQVTEGQSIALTLRLAVQPTFNTTVTLSLNSSILGLSTTSFIFTPANYNVPKNLTVTAVPNDGNENSETVVLKASASGMTDSLYSILAIDKDTRVVISNITVPFTEGQSGSMQVALSGNPVVPANVNLNSSFALVTLGNTVLSFDSSNWNVPQTVTISALDDANFLLDQSTITGSGTNLISASALLDIKDKDVGMLNGAVAYFPFNGNANDESGNGNHGTPNGASLTTNRYGYKDRAYIFDGVNDWIQTANEENLDIGTQSVTMTAWISAVSLFSESTIMSKYNSSTNNASYNMSVLTNGKLHYALFETGGVAEAGYITESSNGTIQTGMWIQVTSVISYILNTVSFYVNGVLISSTATSTFPSSVFNSNEPFRIGYSIPTPPNPNTFFNGKIDDIRIYNRALSDAEVLALYNDTSEVRSSCKQILADGLSAGDGVYTIDPDGIGGNSPFQVYCDMSSNGGGWTLAMKANGNLNTFEYSSPYWTDSNLYPATALTDIPDLTQNELKGPAFTSLGFNEILLRFDTAGTVRELNLTVPVQTSMQTMFNGGFIATSVGRASWKNLVPNSSLQYNCNREGVNNGAGGARIGILANQEADCGSCDSSLGIGTGYIPIGNFCTFVYGGCDNGSLSVPSFAYVFIR
ncbi:MAG TPA: fibrinogen-like YCDxxxxGGGW domain-containing protein [Leptospiraceae bacterium]|nr:fibrinogen-like YCDxxxxGGGW domain-containing protein [Leptospiraceae bacterium]